MLSKVRHFVDKKTSWTQKIPVLFGHGILILLKDWLLQKKSLCLIHFLNHNTYTAPVFKDSNILKFPEKIALENCIFIMNYFNQTLPTPFKNWFTHSTDSHTHNTRSSNLGYLKILPHKTKIYRKQSVNISAIYIWNYL